MVATAEGFGGTRMRPSFGGGGGGVIGAIAAEPEPTPPPPGSKDPPKDRTKREHTTGTIPLAKVALLRAAVAKVLSGGPYEPEYPVSEGISCHVALATASAPPFLVVDKAYRKKTDAVNDLLNAL